MQKANATVSHGLHVGSGELEGPLHRKRVERRHPLALDLQVQPGKRETGGGGDCQQTDRSASRACVSQGPLWANKAVRTRFGRTF